jgi:hypothetical protein
MRRFGAVSGQFGHVDQIGLRLHHEMTQASIRPVRVAMACLVAWLGIEPKRQRAHLADDDVGLGEVGEAERGIRLLSRQAQKPCRGDEFDPDRQACATKGGDDGQKDLSGQGLHGGQANRPSSGRSWPARRSRAASVPLSLRSMFLRISAPASVNRWPRGVCRGSRAPARRSGTSRRRPVVSWRTPKRTGRRRGSVPCRAIIRKVLRSSRCGNCRDTPRLHAVRMCVIWCSRGAARRPTPRAAGDGGRRRTVGWPDRWDLGRLARGFARGDAM